MAELLHDGPDGQHLSPWVRTDEPLLWLGGAGHEVRESVSYFHDCQRRADSPHYCLQLTLNGCGFYEDRRGRTLLPAGTAFFDRIPGEFSYGYPPESREPYEQVWVSLVGEAAEQWWRHITQTFGTVLKPGTETPLTELMLTTARQQATAALPDRYLLSAQLHQLLMTLVSVLNHSRVAADARMARALALVAQRGQDSDFGIGHLAAELDCSREHLSRQFHAATGVSPSDYLMQHRLRLAARALRQTPDKLELIARRCGFGSANYLCRAFRQRFGVTPAQFRAQPWLMAR